MSLRHVFQLHKAGAGASFGRVLALSAWLQLGSAAHAEPLAVLAGVEHQPVRTFLERSSGSLPGSIGVLDARRADLDADGREELVMLWSLYGASSSWPSITVFRRGPQGWREAGTQDLAGQVGRLEIQGREILLELRLPDADDPRCCPSRSVTRRYQWSGMQLTGAKAADLALR